MYEQIIKEKEPEMDKVIDFVTKKISSFRTGRATPALIEDIQAECFGQMMPIKQLAAISVPSARTLSIQPWDKSYMEAIEKAISREGAGLSPVISGDVILINMPQMSEELRKELAKALSQINDDAKRTIRKNRDEAWSDIQDKTRDGLIREDDKFKAKDKLQELVDKYNKKVDDLIDRKKVEIEG
ncbi:MAG TPA: ribosome-recycling factor [Candidatus Pacearchaeota archaeon]|nr:ribosome-recycling factor [Candidatus Pacearchaeota archaeon]HPR80254.1 ribosome-recycling factor [Candidatus Pacearchaeota archaeon]